MTKAMVLLLVLAALIPAGYSAGETPFPVRLVIPAKPGGVVFYHFLHAQRANFDCKTCHAALWPQDAKSPLKFKTGGHQAAESGRTSCGNCHRPGGAFGSQGNCTTRCHSNYAGSISTSTE
jgi:c(7)-type cytochrome triheme protein